MEPALGNAVTELDADFEASFQAAWQKLEQLCEEAVRDDKRAEKEKRQDSERGKLEKTKRSLETSTKGRQEGSSKSDSSKKTKEKGISGSLNSSERKRKFSHVAKRSTGFPSLLGEDEKEEKFPLPTMSFEEYLNYDHPQKKKAKRAVRASVSAGKEEQPRVDSSCSCQPSPSRKRSHEQRGEQEPPEAPEPKRILLNEDIKLPEIPLPPIQARCSPLPAAESPPCPQKKRRAAPSAAEEPEGGFPGCRVYSKTPVFSGLNTARVPRAPSQQPVPGVTNNTASICQAGGVSVVEPALGRCPPEQLCGTEGRHHVLIEDTDQLWHNHCLRDFKNEKPEEFESWREMYLRLHDAREQRLLMLARNIGSAHANKPKGRVAKMAYVNSAAKPPRDVRRRQEKFGTGGALLPEKTKIKPVLYTSSKSHARVSEEQSYDGPSTSSAHSVPSSASTFSSCDPRKPPVKKIAPMMAKTIKAFKNRFSRR